MSEVYEENFKEVSKYVHATSRGHEAIQLAVGMQLLPQDYAFPYYRDDAMLLGIGLTPKDLMAQLLAKADDPFSGGRSYYSHPSLNRDDLTKIPHKEDIGIADKIKKKPIVVCSLGDASVTEGEVSEAMQMASLKQLPIIFLVQDNEWDISASADEIRSQDAYEFASGFKGLTAYTIDGTDFTKSYTMVNEIVKTMRSDRKPVLLHATVPLLNHHTSGVRMEWYRDDLEEDKLLDPYPKIRKALIKSGVTKKEVKQIEKDIYKSGVDQLDEARQIRRRYLITSSLIQPLLKK
jgi:2-oxoisovalerate dehydrogenase E1 component